MKKILIVNNNMVLGGIQKALLNLLKEISGKCEVTLLLFANTGELMGKIPENVRVIKGGLPLRILGISHGEAKAEGLLTFALRSFFAVLTRIFKIGFVFGILSKAVKIPGDYDCAVSFMQNGGERIFYGGACEVVLNSVKAKKKVCFIHCDFLNYGGNNAYNRNTLLRFDEIVAVSDSVGSALLKAEPRLSGMVRTVHNCINSEEINTLKDEYAADYTVGAVNLFTAARLQSEKGILRMIPIFKSIKDSGGAFVWRIAGGGADRAEAERQIKNAGLSENIVLLGSLENPYPYFYGADIVLVPSYNEAAPMVFGEARALGTPVFTTDTLSARELTGENDWVCENDDGKIREMLGKVISDFTPRNPAPYCGDNTVAVNEFLSCAE